MIEAFIDIVANLHPPIWNKTVDKRKLMAFGCFFFVIHKLYCHEDIVYNSILHGFRQMSRSTCHHSSFMYMTSWAQI